MPVKLSCSRIIALLPASAKVLVQQTIVRRMQSEQTRKLVVGPAVRRSAARRARIKMQPAAGLSRGPASGSSQPLRHILAAEQTGNPLLIFGVLVERRFHRANSSRRPHGYRCTSKVCPSVEVFQHLDEDEVLEQRRRLPA